MGKYSFKIGLWKSIKNSLIVMGLPAILYLVNNYSEWMPADAALKLAPLFGFLSYFAKNFIENKNK